MGKCLLLEAPADAKEPPPEEGTPLPLWSLAFFSRVTSRLDSAEVAPGPRDWRVGQRFMLDWQGLQVPQRTLVAAGGIAPWGDQVIDEAQLLQPP